MNRYVFYLTISAWFGIATSAAAATDDGILYIYAHRGNDVQIGTGFFLDRSGTFVTAYHVMKGAVSADIYDDRGTKFVNVQLMASDPTNDLAVLTTNTSSTNFFTVVNHDIVRLDHFTTVGHPWGFKYQTFEFQSTQDGFANSTALHNKTGDPIYSKNIPVIPTNLTIYGGMSGAPMIATDGSVAGMLVGSFNEGGSLGWAIPSKQILALVTPIPTNRSDLSKVAWSSMDNVSSAFRDFSLTKGLSASQTVKWLNDKWQEHGVKDLNLNGFIGHVQSTDVRYLSDKKVLEIQVDFDLTGDKYRTTASIALEDALRAYKRSGGAAEYHVVVECPKDRSCISFEKQKEVGNVWKTLDKKNANVLAIDSWAMSDADGAARAATAINHIIRLHGGPIQHDEAFDAK